MIATAARPEALTQRTDAEIVPSATALQEMYDAPQSSEAPTSEAETQSDVLHAIGAAMLTGAHVTPLREIIGEEGRQKVEARYSALENRVLDTLARSRDIKFDKPTSSDSPEPNELAVEPELAPQPISTVTMLESASRGEKLGRSQMLMNISTHTDEIFEGVGAYIVVEGIVRDDGHIEQFGQTHEHRQETTLVAFPNQTPALRATTHVEGRTVFGIEEGREKLDGQIVGETSAMSDEAGAATLDAAHYFLEDMVAIARFTRFEDRETAAAEEALGKAKDEEIVGQEVTTESILLGGVDPESVAPMPKNPTEADRLARLERLLAARYDIRVLAKVRRDLGLKTPEGMTANQMLADAFVGNVGAIEFAMLYDFHAATEVAEGKKTFFGSVALWKKYGEPEELTRELYENHLAEVAARAAARKALNEKAVDLVLERYQALSDAQKETLQPVEAAEILRKATLDVSTRAAVTTYQEVSLGNLGDVAWREIQDGRDAWNRGDFDAAESHISRAQETAVDPACPTGPGTNNPTQNDSGEASGSRSMTCPFCKDPYQFGDPCATIIKCTKCHALVVGGQVKSRGVGGQSARKGKTSKMALIGSAKMNLSESKPEQKRETRHVVGWLSLENA
jgi:hypothetical protein